MQDLPYSQQLDLKQKQLETLLAGYWSSPVPITPSPRIWHYRNKVDPSFDRMHYPEPPTKDFVRETALGFRRKNRWNITLDLQTCLIGPERLPDLMQAVRGWYKRHELKPYHSRSKQGYLRFLLVREGQRTGHRMVVLITAPGDAPKDDFIAAVQQSFDASSILWGTNLSAAEVATADSLTILSGEDHIDEYLTIPGRGNSSALRFRLSPFSFFQTNSLGAEQLYGIVRKWVGEIRPGNFYDLYGGSGAIGLACADQVGEIVSVESVGSATSDGETNARANNVENIRFVRQEVENYLHQAKEQGLDPDAVAVLDPPRVGLHPKALAALLKWRPREAIYVSCNPEAFAREMPVYLEHYDLAAVEAVDMFPHTRHVELLARLIRK